MKLVADFFALLGAQLVSVTACSADEIPWDMDVDGQGNVYVAGTTQRPLPGQVMPIRVISSMIKHWEVEPLPAGSSPSRLAVLIGFCQPSAAVAGGR